MLLLVLVLVVGGCAAPSTSAPAPAAEAAEAVTTYANPDALVDTEWVIAHLDDPNVRLIDLSGNAEDYAAGHVPGAVFANLGDDFTNPEDPVRGQILTQDQLSALFSRLGVTEDTTVVFYDNSGNLAAARAYWAVKYYQHADVRVYNGGLKQWTAAGQALSTDEPAITPTEYVAKDADLAIRTTTEYVLEHLEDDNVVLCDTRGPEEYAGTDVRSARGGHIPGALNVEWVNAVNEDGTFKDAATLYKLYTTAGFLPDKEIITYCQTGVRGAHTWFVLTELLGYPNVRNYDGSWEDYGNQPDTPIES
jgi:thiosulfate/3-mercaptopyruvate sulfurtransferase